MNKKINILLILAIILVSCAKEEQFVIPTDNVDENAYLKYYRIQDVMPPRIVEDGILFTFAENYNEVEVAGDFNNWEGSIPLVKGIYGIFYFLWQEPLKAGNYAYKYRVNGVWINDPLALNKTVDEGNQEISYFEIKKDLGFLRANPTYNNDGTVTFFYSNANAYEVMFTSAQLGFNTSRYLMTSNIDNIWRITLNPPDGVYNYNFVVDREWKIDPLNMNVVKGNDNRLHSQVFIKRPITK